MIYIKELLPNPVGRDAEGEWIKLINKGEEKIDLSGWQIKDASGKVFTFSSKQMLPEGELRLMFSDTRISLNNDGDKVILYDSGGKELDSLNYGAVSEGETVLAEKFREVVTGQSLKATPNQALTQGLITESYETWPLLVGVLVACLAGVVGGIILKKVLNLS